MSRMNRSQWLARRPRTLASPPDNRRLRLEPLEDRRMLAIFVDNLVDEADGSITDGDISLRDAIALAAPGETIGFVSGGTIDLTLGELVIDKDLTIATAGGLQLTIDAGHGADGLPNTGDGHRVFNISDNTFAANLDVTLNGLTLTGGDPAAFRNGGAILNGESLTIRDSVISGNAATKGGGVYSRRSGVLNIIDSSLTGNLARELGGGLYVNNSQANLTNAIIHNNVADSGGGVFSNDCDVTISGGTVSNNIATEDGGGFYFLFSFVSISDLAITGNSADRGGGIMLVLSALDINGSSITGNTATTSGGGIYSSNGFAEVMESTIHGNNATNDISAGGGITAYGGSVHITQSTISDNTAEQSGGGIFIPNVSDDQFFGEQADVTLVESTISDNSVDGATGVGGGIANQGGSLRIEQSTLSGNSASGAGSGGGIYQSVGSARVVNSTFSGNSAGFGQGGGIFNAASLEVLHTTLTDNGAASGGGGISNYAGGTATLSHSIVSGNFSGLSVGSTRNEIFNSGAITVDDYNLFGNSGRTTARALDGVTPGATDILATSDGLQPTALIDIIDTTLADNIGPTLTHALAAGSPAIDAGDPAFTSPPDSDQRGFPFVRQFGARIDIGAIEEQTATLVVNTLVDESNGSGDFSLREAVEFANATPGLDSISFAPDLAGGTIDLTLGQLEITDNVSIVGLGADQLAVDAGGNSRVFDVALNAAASISGLTIRGGNADNGGGIRTAVNTEVTLAAVFLSGNTAAADGGGLYARSNLTIIDSTISGNAAGDDGGGLWIYNDEENFGERARITNSTISGNTAADRGGGVYTDLGATLIRHSTITRNAAMVGDGVLSRASGLNRTDFHSSIVANNTDDDDVASLGPGSNSIDSSGYNLVGGGNAASSFNEAGDQTGVSDPGLASLGDYGGPTPTHVPRLSSPAIDAGDPAAVAGAGSVRMFDQRRTGFDRIKGTAIDVGAVEQETLDALVVDTLEDTVDYDYSPGDVSLRELLEFANDVSGSQSISFSPGLAGGTLKLASGELEITDDVTITGLGAGQLTIDADGGSRVFSVGVNQMVHISGLKLTGGNADRGGGIRSASNADLTLTAVVISGNTATINGGGIQSYGSLRITDSTISGNMATGDGGGVWISNDFFTPSGSNVARLTNSTISGNTAGDEGGGIHASYGRTIIRHSTITGNTAQDGDGISSFNDFFDYNRTEVHSSIIAGNTDNDDVRTTGAGSTSIRSDDFNLVGGGNAAAAFSDPGDQTGVTDPMLGELTDNGGQTPTHLPEEGSAAIDMGDPEAEAGAAGVPSYDQRQADFNRISGSAIDVGAVEVQQPSADFDHDGDVDGIDLLAWQRGLGASPAIPSDGDADNDADVDGDDLDVWENQFGQSASLAAAGTVAAVSLSAEEPPANASLIDAAMALEWMNQPAADAESDVVIEKTIDETSATDESSLALLPAVEHDSPPEEQTSSGETDKSADVWLSDELLESVFG